MKNKLFNSLIFLNDTKSEETIKDNNKNINPLINKPSIHYYKGKSFRFYSEWFTDHQYYNDEYFEDWILYDKMLLACNKTHFSSKDNKPIIKYDSFGNILGLEKMNIEIVFHML